MKQKLSFFRLTLNAVLALVLGLAFSPDALGAGIGVGLFAVSTAAQTMTGGAPLFSGFGMALQTEVWIADIQEQLYYGNEFLWLAQDHTQFIKNKTVHIPQAGTNPNVEKNRATLVADVAQRADTELTYDLDNYTTDPILVKNVEDLQVSYDKRQSVLGSHIAVLGDTVAKSTLQKWACSNSTTHVIRTTGDATADLPHGTATGTRLKLTRKDMAKAAARMDLDKVPAIGRFMVIPACMFYDLFTDSDLVRSRATINEDMLAKGVIAELYGFNIIKRGEVVLYNSAATPVIKGENAAAAATDCGGAVGFSRFFTTQALGEIMVYINEGEARSYGDIMSAEVNHGASVMRPNNVGRVSIAQGYVAP